MPKIMKPIPSYFTGPIPPPMPIGVSPVQQANAAKAAADEPQASSPQDELDKLFPQALAVTVQVFKARDEEGRALREPRVVHLEEATMKEWAAIARPIRTLANATEAGVDIATMIEQNGPQVVEAISAATGLPTDVVFDLKSSDIASLIEAVVKVNAGFFLLRLPQLFTMVTRLGGRVLGGGQTLSPTSTESESPTRPH